MYLLFMHIYYALFKMSFNGKEIESKKQGIDIPPIDYLVSHLSSLAVYISILRASL